MPIALAKDVEEFLLEQVRVGVCADASELANDVLRSVREQMRKPFEVTPELEAWAASIGGPAYLASHQGGFRRHPRTSSRAKINNGGARAARASLTSQKRAQPFVFL